jgi:hypothetical protein
VHLVGFTVGRKKLVGKTMYIMNITFILYVPWDNSIYIKIKITVNSQTKYIVGAYKTFQPRGGRLQEIHKYKKHLGG